MTFSISLVILRIEALFSCKKNYKMDTMVLSFVFDKYYQIMDSLGSKDLSGKLKINYAISYFFNLYLIFYTCTAKFAVIQNLKYLAIFFGTKQGLSH